MTELTSLLVDPAAHVRAAAAQAIAGMPHLVLEGAFTHFACADLDGHAATGGQLERFRAALDAMRAAGVLPPLVHAANSSALIAVAAAHFDMVRPGLALYGIRPCSAARIKSRTIGESPDVR